MAPYALHVPADSRVVIDVMQPDRIQRTRRNSLSLIEFLVGTAIVVIILAISISGHDNGRAPMNATEMAVISEIRSIQTAQATYLSQYKAFAASLAQLGPPASGEPGPSAADLIPASLASGEKDGYLFIITATPQGYTINANPKVYNSGGRRTFYSDQTMSIHQNWSAEPANARSPELK